MTTISQQITDHLKQCHETFDSERLLELARDEIDRLNHEMEATKEAARAREAMLREALDQIPDRIDLYRLIKATKARKHGDIASVIGTSLNAIRSAALNSETN